MSRLLGYGARSTLSPLSVLLLATWLALLVTTFDSTPAHLELAAPESSSMESSEASDSAALAARALRRQGLWVAWLAVFLPLVVVRAAATGARAGSRDASWLASAALSRPAALRAAGALLLGATLASLGAVATAALGIELAVGQSSMPESLGPGARSPRTRPPRTRPPARFLGRVLHPALLLDAHTRRGVLELELPAGAAARPAETEPPRSGAADSPTVRVRLRALGPTRGRVVMTLARGEPSTTLERELNYHETLELALPAGTGRTTLELEWNCESGAYLLTSNDIELFGVPRAERLASADIAARLALALPVWLTLAFALSFWMRPAFAAAAVGGLQVGIWLAERAAPLLPAADFIEALRWTGAARLAAPLPLVAALCGALAICALTVGASAAGMRRGRQT